MSDLTVPETLTLKNENDLTPEPPQKETLKED